MRLDSIRRVSANIRQDAENPAHKKRGHSPIDTANEQNTEEAVIVTHGDRHKPPETYGQYNCREKAPQKPEDEPRSAASEMKEAGNPFANGQGVSEQSGASEALGAGTSSPTDDSGELTRRLVAAQDVFTVQMILTEAFKGIGGLRMTISMGSDDDAKAARAILKKLEKVVSRSRRKISDLGDEEQLQRKQITAEREEKAKQAREIKAELRKREMERKRREQGYLRDANEEAVANSGNRSDSPAAPRLDAATEARLEAQAEAMALADAGPASVSADTGGIDGGGQSTAGTSSGSGGADGAAAVASDAGGVDIAV